LVETVEEVVSMVEIVEEVAERVVVADIVKVGVEEMVSTSTMLCIIEGTV
jgi:hypothetical protein